MYLWNCKKLLCSSCADKTSLEKKKFYSEFCGSVYESCDGRSTETFWPSCFLKFFFILSVMLSLNLSGSQCLHVFTKRGLKCLNPGSSSVRKIQTTNTSNTLTGNFPQCFSFFTTKCQCYLTEMTRNWTGIIFTILPITDSPPSVWPHSHENTHREESDKDKCVSYISRDCA